VATKSAAPSQTNVIGIPASAGAAAVGSTSSPPDQAGAAKHISRNAIEATNDDGMQRMASPDPSSVGAPSISLLSNRAQFEAGSSIFTVSKGV
jgi:hypothetical protein